MDGLALSSQHWHGTAMTEPKKPAPRAAGGVLAIAIIAGALIGVAYHQSTIGLLAGTAVGVAAAVLFWLVDRKR